MTPIMLLTFKQEEDDEVADESSPEDAVERMDMPSVSLHEQRMTLGLTSKGNLGDATGATEYDQEKVRLQQRCG